MEYYCNETVIIIIGGYLKVGDSNSKAMTVVDMHNEDPVGNLRHSGRLRLGNYLDVLINS